MKKYAIATAVLVCLLATAYFIVINDMIISIRLSELSSGLEEQDLQERNIDHIGLIATYEINKKIYEKSLTRENADTLERAVDSVVGREKRSTPLITTKYGVLAVPAIWVINFNRSILGKKPLAYRDRRDASLAELDRAYFYERNMLFPRAITLYDRVLAEGKIGDALRASVLLHQGYCYALSGLNEKARNSYRTILERYSQESAAITAGVLLKYLEGFQRARERVLGSNVDPLTMSRDLVNLLAYNEALRILDDAEKKAGPADIPGIKYFKARCYNGLGRPEKAVESHLEVITSSPASPYARYSNRRLFLIGAKSGDAGVAEMAVRLNKQLKDPVLEQMAGDHGEIEETPDVSKIPVPEKLREKVDAITAAPAAAPQPAPGTRLTVSTSDGNTFKGALVKQTPAEIVLQTSIGRVSVKREKITAITPEK